MIANRWKNMAVFAAVALVLSGCSGTSHEADAAELEKATSSAVKAAHGVNAKADCGKESLTVKKGATAHCSVTVEGESTSREAEVIVTEINAEGYGVDVRLKPEISQEVPIISPTEVKGLAANGISTYAKVSPRIACSEPLTRSAGAKSVCQAWFTGEKKSRDVTVTVGQVKSDGSVTTSVDIVPSISKTPLFDSRKNVSGVVAAALKNSFGEMPTASCGEGYLEIKEGVEIRCDIWNAQQQPLGAANVVLQGVSGGTYTVRVSLEQNG